MAKKNENEKREVKLGLNDLSSEAANALRDLGRIQEGMSVEDIINAAEIIKSECGNATVEATYDDYWGPNQDITWSRLETDDEVKNRVAKSEKQRKTAARNREKAKLKRIEDDKAELARLKILYPNET